MPPRQALAPKPAPAPAATPGKVVETPYTKISSHLSAMGWGVMGVTLLAALTLRFKYGGAIAVASPESAALLYFFLILATLLHLPATVCAFVNKKNKARRKDKAPR